MKETAPLQPYLSIVAASRNDDHGGDPLQRTQVSLNCFARQCERFGLQAEVILIDWNPVIGRPGLADVLKMPENPFCSGRVITVPGELHRRFKYGDRLAFFQMIAKNVGIRRARGQFIMATNIDIVFSDELIAYIAKRSLETNHCYRVDRHDVANGVKPQDDLDVVLAHCLSKSLRQHRRYAPAELVSSLYGAVSQEGAVQPDLERVKQFQGVRLVEDQGVAILKPERTAPVEHLHSNGCGDFTMLSREGWDHIRGYPEYEAFSFNIDSVGFLFAHYSGFTEATLLPPCVAFHLEHSIGSGWTPEGEKALFERLENAGILNPDWPTLRPVIEGIRSGNGNGGFNDEHWGLSLFDLPEAPLRSATPRTPALVTLAGSDAWPRWRVSALRPEHDLDRITLFTERRLRRLNNPVNTGTPAPALESERKRLEGEWIALRAERNALESDRRVFSQERNTLANEYNTLAMERQFVAEARRRLVEDRFLLARTGGTNVDPNNGPLELLEVFFPSASGEYMEERKVVGKVVNAQFAVQRLSIPKFSWKYRLRVDVGAHPGTATIRALSLFTGSQSEEIADLDQLRKLDALAADGTARMVTTPPGKPLVLISTGLDPQLLIDLSRLKGAKDVALFMLVEVAFVSENTD